MIWIKKCKECGEPYDQDVSQELCPKCRKGKFEINGGRRDEQRIF